MRRITTGLAALLLGASSMGAAAQSRPDTQGMTCGQARGLVARYGAMVMTTGPGTYERIVADGRFCLMGESALPAFARTRDAPRCHAGYYCGQSQEFLPD